MQDVIGRVIEAEAEAQRILAAARAEADQILAEARKNAEEYRERIRRETREQAGQLKTAILRAAHQEKQESLARLMATLEVQPPIDEASRQKSIEFAVGEITR